MSALWKYAHERSVGQEGGRVNLIHRASGRACTAWRFNICSLNEIEVYWEDGSGDSGYIRDYDVILSDGTRMPLSEAFR